MSGSTVASEGGDAGGVMREMCVKNVVSTTRVTTASIGRLSV